jgi:hypothetical protein
MSSALLLASVLLLLIGPSSTQASSSALLVQARLTTAGPYGSLWTARLGPDGKLAVRVLNMNGSLSGTFTVNYLDLLERAIISEHFFELPSEFSGPFTPELANTSAVFHMPDLTLEVTLGSKKHKVNMYNPDAMKDDQRAVRFLKVWDTLFLTVPTKPTWPGFPPVVTGLGKQPTTIGR